MSVSARTDQDLYVLMLTQPNGRQRFWLTTISTNRAQAWRNARPFTKAYKTGTGDWVRELKSDGFSCVRVRLRLETIPEPQYTEKKATRPPRVHRVPINNRQSTIGNRK